MHRFFAQSRLMTGLLLCALLAAALWARLNSISWDGYAGLHPDERHLLFVTQTILSALSNPSYADLAWQDLWYSDQSPLNPHLGAASYVYGEAPLLAGALLARALGATDWFAVMPVVRSLSSVVDVATMLGVFIGARLLAGNAAALVAAAIYAAMPSALQLSSFHTVDVWLAATCTGALVPMIALATGRGNAVTMAALAGAFIGFAMASKITGVLMLGPGLLALGLAWRAGLNGRAVLVAALCATLTLAVVFRLTNPFAFAGPGLLGLALSPDYIADFTGLADVTASPDFPPNWQWIAGYGPLRLARDFVLFGFGPVAVFLALGLRRSVGPGALVALATVAVFVVLTAISSVAALRYGAPALPALAIALAPVVHRISPVAILAVLIGAVYWGAGAVRLHDGAHPRLLASQWLWALPRGTILTNESGWDEDLPTIVRLEGEAQHRWPNHDDWFTIQSLDITDPDTPEKAARIAQILARTDVLILSSDRQSAVMPRLPERFPMTTAHYDALMSGQACFAPALVLDRGYPLPFLSLPDQWAQEPWRVYDHPIVRIFLREPCFSQERYEAFLRAALRN